MSNKGSVSGRRDAELVRVGKGGKVYEVRGNCLKGTKVNK